MLQFSAFSQFWLHETLFRIYMFWRQVCEYFELLVSYISLDEFFCPQELSESVSKGDELVSMETERYCGVKPIAQDEQNVRCLSANIKIWTAVIMEHSMVGILITLLEL